MLPVILTATFMASFDYMVVNVAAPSLRAGLHAGPAALELVIGGYAFTYAAGMVTSGRLGDLFGYRRLFLLGMSAFTVASLLCGVAGTSGQLVAARLLQGLAAAAMAPQVLALITAVIPVPERARALSWFGVTLGVGGVAGQVLGGLLLNADLFGLGWRPIFLVNGPVGLVAVTLAYRWLPAGAGGRRPRLDLPGAVGLSAAVALALVPLALGREQGWPVWTWLSLAAAVPVLLATLAWERRVAEPLLDLALFRSRSFTAGLAINVAFMASMASFMFVITLLLQAGLGLSALQAGLVFVPLGLLTLPSSLLGRHLVARFGLRVLTAGAAISAVGVLVPALYLHLSSTIDAAWVSAPMALFGLGSGLTLPAVIGAVLAGVRPDQAGAAAGVLTTTQQFAGAIGLAAIGAIYFAVLPSGYRPATETALWVDFALLAITALLTLLLRSPAPAPTPEPVLNRRL
jgi:EmrB/QacA subfamily drug resistance transporter